MEQQTPLENQPAPDFTGRDAHGIIHHLADYRGKWLLLYFYPKDDTPGCTKEACGIRDLWDQFGAKNAAVLGVSADDEARHLKFAEKHALPFPLIADTEKKISQTYGAWGEKKLLGRAYMGMKRISFLIDPSGVVRKIYETVKPDRHAHDVLADLSTLGQ